MAIPSLPKMKGIRRCLYYYNFIAKGVILHFRTWTFQLKGLYLQRYLSNWICQNGGDNAVKSLMDIWVEAYGTVFWSEASWMRRVGNHSLCKENWWPSLLSRNADRLYIAIFAAIRQARTCGRVLAPGPTPSAPKQCMLRVQTLSAQDRQGRDSRKKKREREISLAALWRVRVSPLTGTVPRKMAKGLHRVSAPCKNRTMLSNSLWSTLTAKPWVHVDLFK